MGKDNAEAIRCGIRDAMERLLLGKPLRSDGKLTIKSLAVEAGVKRWVLTHKNTDLQDEFRIRCEQQGDTPENQKLLIQKNELMKHQLGNYKNRVNDLTEENHRLTRVVQVLTLENLQLQEKIGEGVIKVNHLR